jgi:hypothetical protein
MEGAAIFTAANRRNMSSSRYVSNNSSLPLVAASDPQAFVVGATSSYVTESGLMLYGANSGYDFVGPEPSSDPVRYTFFKEGIGPYFDERSGQWGACCCIAVTADGQVIEGQNFLGRKCPGTTEELVHFAEEIGYRITQRIQAPTFALN